MPGTNLCQEIRKRQRYLGNTKLVLGWILDTVEETILLPQRPLDRLRAVSDALPRFKMRIAVSAWHKTLGKLCSMSLTIPGLRGLFSLLQEALWHQHKQRICLTHKAHDFLDDICWLVQDLHQRPTRFRKVVPTTPVLHGACDAAKSGMGSVFFAPTPSGELFPCLWGTPFPSEIQNQVVLWDNSSGTITHSDLALAGTIMHHDVANHAVDLRECTISTLTDNTPALA